MGKIQPYRKFLAHCVLCNKLLSSDKPQRHVPRFDSQKLFQNVVKSIVQRRFRQRQRRHQQQHLCQLYVTNTFIVWCFVRVELICISICRATSPTAAATTKAGLVCLRLSASVVQAQACDGGVEARNDDSASS